MSYNNILIVDDDPLVHVVTQGILDTMGATSVTSAYDGMEAFGLLDRNLIHFDLILCDLNMPNMDGVAFIKKLSTIKYTGAIAIISSESSALIDAAYRMARIVNITIVGTIQKPVTPEALLEIWNKQQASLSISAGDMPSEPVWTQESIRDYLETNRFCPVYQPKFNLKKKRITGCEVLGRILNDSGNLTPPARFLEAAENLNLITKATERLANQVAHDLASWKQQGIAINASINVSPLSLFDTAFPDRMDAIFRHKGIDPTSITLEIIENHIIAHNSDVLEVMSRCRLKGFKLSLDDFGTGAASMDQLRNFPFTELKLDQSFVRDLTTNPVSQQMLELASQISEQLGLVFVAEGVETKDLTPILQKANVTEIQGYLLAKPMPSAEFITWYHGKTRKMATNTTAINSAA